MVSSTLPHIPSMQPDHPWYPAFRRHLAQYGMRLDEAEQSDWQDFVEFFGSLSPERQELELADAKEVALA